MTPPPAVALIPARGGSKRIPRKNITPFCGKPMIAHAIETAQQSGLFDRIIVSTDDAEIKAIALEWGAHVPFIRPSKLANDTCPTLDVIRHALNWLHQHDQQYAFTCCIYPTAPFIRASDLKEGFKRVQDEKIHFSFPVARFNASIFRALKITETNRLEMIWPSHRNTRTQDLPDAFHDTGQFYWGKTKSFLSMDSVFTSVASPILIPRYLAQDIDTPEDWTQAELMFKALHPIHGR